MDDNQMWISVLILIAFLSAVGMFLQYSSDRDKMIIQSANRYETCVKTQYHTTPAAWYEEHGSYPECPTEE